MRSRLVRFTAALAGVAVTAGCGLTGSEPNEPSVQSGKIAVGDKSQRTQSVKCQQTEWQLAIDAKADPGRAHALLQLGGNKPTVQTVNIQNIDGLNGISGGTVAEASASVKGNSVYTITGTAIVTDPAHPAQTVDMPFTIEAPC